MIDFNITNEEKNALKYYRDEGYKAINQILVSNGEADIALLSDEVEKEVVSIKYDRESVIEYLNTAKTIYRIILKKYYEDKKVYNTTFYRGSNLAEVEMLKVSPYIDKFLIATVNKNDAENKFASNWNRPASMNITLLGDIPYLQVKDVLKAKKYDKDIIISPFTKVKTMNESSEKTLDKNSKTIKIYNIELEKQELDELTKEEREGLYKYILENSLFIGRKLEECINLEKENVSNFENIRKLEQLLSKYENSEESEEEDKDSINEKVDDIERITKELNEIKKASTDLFEIRKDNINFINMWKRNIAVYMIAECREIEKEFSEVIEEINSDEEDFDEDNEDIVEVDTSESKENKVEDNVEDEKQEEVQNEKQEDFIPSDDLAYATAIDTCNENITNVEKMLSEINVLISKQQNHAKIAGNIGASYSALNNAFDIKKVTENLLNNLKDIKLKIEELRNENNKDDIVTEKLKKISKNNIEISTLINYLNNPKIAVQNSRIDRFDEMAIIEENELKRVIAEKIREIRGEAELKKLKDDIEIISDKGPFRRFIGMFTGRNKLDEFMLDQIELMQKAIRKTLSRKMSLAYNYSVHELLADIEMFLEDNEDEEIIENDISSLKTMSDELKKNFVVSENKVQAIVDKKEHRNLPVEKRRLSKRELIEIETYRFLNKYGYDISYVEKEEPKYQDTMAHEIGRVIEYINSSDIF